MKKLLISLFLLLPSLVHPIFSINKSFSDDILFDLYIQDMKRAEEFQISGEFENAIEILKKSLKLAEKIHDKTRKCDVLIKLGLMYWNIGDLSVSTEYYSQALSISASFNLKSQKEISEKSLKIFYLYSEGKDYRSTGETEKSIESFKNAIKLSKELGSKEHEVKCLRQLSTVYLNISNFSEFYILNKQALDIAVSLKHKKEQGRCLNNIGIFYKSTNNYTKALNYFEESLKIARELNNKNDESNILNNIGNIYKNVGLYEKALDYLESALIIDKELGSSIYILIDLVNIGDTYRNKGLISNKVEDFYKALDFFISGLELARTTKTQKSEKDILNRIEVRVLNNLGSVHTDLKNYQKALEYFQLGYEKAEEIQDLESLGMILNNIGIIHYNQGNYEESTKYYKQAIDLAQKLEGGQILWEAFFEIGNSYARQNKYFEALKNYKNSIRIIENIRSQLRLEELKASYLGTDKRIEAYHNLIHILVALHKKDSEIGYDREAFNYLERAKARAFLDSLEVSQVDISLGINFKLKNQENELMKDISNIYNKLLAVELTSEEIMILQQQLIEKENELETLKREIRSKSPDYADLKYPEIISLKETQKKLLDSNTAIFAYTIGHENAYGFSITKNSLKIFPVPKKSEIQNLISDYLITITDKDTKDFSLGYELFRRLVFPGLDKNIKKNNFYPS